MTYEERLYVSVLLKLVTTTNKLHKQLNARDRNLSSFSGTNRDTIRTSFF